jgi:hypothetical protein
MQKQVEVSRADSGEFVCIATFLPVRRWRDIIPFLRMTSRVERQLKETKGLIRYGLRTDFFRKYFWTYTVWKDRGSVNIFVRAEPHSMAVERFKEWAGEGPAFVEWNCTDASINWKEAMERLKNPTFYYKT